MKRLGFFVLAITFIFFGSAGQPYAKGRQLSCTDLTTGNLKLKGVVITSQEEMADVSGDYCKLSG